MVPFNRQSPGYSGKGRDSSFLKKRFENTPLFQGKNRPIPHCRSSTIPTTSCFSAQGTADGPPQGLQLLCVLPQAPGSGQGAQRSMGLHGVQSGTAPGLSGRPRWPEAPCGKTISHLAAYGSFLGTCLLGRLPIPHSSELSDKADGLTAGKKQGAQSCRDPDWGHLRAPDLRWGKERTLGQ